MSQISRVTRSKQQARIAYNKLSRWYDLLSGGFEDKPRNFAIQKLALKVGDIAMDLGCGTGKTIPIMAEMVGEKGMVLGVSLSEGMLAQSKKRLRPKMPGETINLVAGDGSRLPFEKGGIDKIPVSFTLELFDTPEIPVVLAECTRVLNKEGLISAVALSKKDPNLIIKVYEWIHNKSPQWIDCRPIFLQETLEMSGFKILSADDFNMMGLKGESVLAQSIGYEGM